jgi:hypothetical protein
VLGTFGTQFFALLAAMPVIRRPAAVAKAAAKAEAKAEAKAVGKGALDKGKSALDKGKGKGKGALDKGKDVLDKSKGKDIDMDTNIRWVEFQGYLREAFTILLNDQDTMSKGKDKGKGKDEHTMSMGKGKDMATDRADGD